MAAMCVGLGNRLFASSMTSVGMLAGKPLGNNVTVIGNSVDRSLFDPESTSLHRSSVKFRQEHGLIGSTVVFCPARITPSKGQLDILKAAKHLKSLGYDFTYIFAGVEDKAYARKLREFAYKHFLRQMSLCLV